MHISRNDREFIVKALQEEIRIDGRNPFDSRKVTIKFGQNDDSATVSLGSTRVLTTITPVLEAPYPDRPNEGTLRFNVEYSPMASPEFGGGRPSEGAMEMIRLLEQVLRNSRAVDREALCVLAGHKVWHLDVKTTILDHAGNLTDACLLSAVAALMVFRRPEVEVTTDDSGTGSARAVALSPAVREPLPLSLHQLPLSATFALFGDGESIAMDPSFREEAAASGTVTVVVNTNSDVCTIRKTSGVSIPIAQVKRLMHLASSRAGEAMQELREVLRQHEASRVSMRVRRRHVAAPQEPGYASRSVTTLPSGDVADEVQRPVLPDEQSESDEGSSSEEEDMSKAEHTGAIEGSIQLPPANSAGEQQSNARTLARSAVKRTAVGIQKPQTGVLDFLEDNTELQEDLHSMRKALQTKERRVV